jgi:PAS domain S-box-containing protein
VTKTVKFVVHQGTIKRTIKPAVLVRCALVALSCTTTFGREHRPVTTGPAAPGVVGQAHAEARTITLPVVDGEGIRFRRLSTDEGLSQTKITQIVQDDQGFIWFGTQYGLNRFDGYNFKVFLHDPTDPNSLSGVFANALFKDRDGALWVGCDQFLNKFNRETETFTQYPVPFVTDMSQDSAGILWLATPNGLYSLDPAAGTIRHYAHDPDDPSSLSNNLIKSSAEDKEGRFWVATIGYLDEFDRRTGKVPRHHPVPGTPAGFGFYKDRFGAFWIFHDAPNALSVFDPTTNTLTNYSFQEPEPSPAPLTVIMAMTEDRDGTLWLATHGAGLLKFDREQQRFIRYRYNPGDPYGLPQNNVENIFADREGSIWAGLGRMGVTHFATNPQPFKRILGLASSDGTPEPFVGAICEDTQGILWIATPAALNRIDRKDGHYTFYRRGEGPAVSTDGIAINEDPTGNLWVGTYNHGLLRLDQRTGKFQTLLHNPADPYSLSNDIVTRLLVDHEGTLWVATSDGLNRFHAATGRFTVYKPDPQRKIVSYQELVEDQKGALWLGTDASGLYRFDPATGQFSKYEHDIRRPGTLSDNRVNSVHFDRSGTMWVGTQDGLDKFDAKTGSFTAYTRRDGLPGNAVGCILEDDHGNLWMSTNNGIAKFDPQSTAVQSYSTAEGLSGPDLTGKGACFKNRSGEMFFGGFNGATFFDPDSVVGGSYIPPVVLTEFRLSGIPVNIGGDSPLSKSITYTTGLTLSHAQRNFSLAFSALSYFSPGTNRYRYQLEGLDNTWHQVGSNERLATYTTLPARVYTFRVQGATSRGAWSKPGVAVLIRILPPWWSTWWFRTLCVAVSLALLGGFYQWRIRQLRRQEKDLRDVVETIPAMAFALRPDGSTEFVNRPWLDYSGLSEKDNLSSGWQLTVHPEDFDGHLNKWRASMATGAPFENEVRHRDAHGAYRWFLVRAVPLRDEHGNVLKWYGTLTDIEDRKRSEQERERFRQLQADLAHENRISIMGQLAASLSHELKQPIAAAITDAKTCLRWLMRDQPNVEEARAATMRTMKDSTRAAEIIDHLQSFYKKDAPPERELVDVNELVREMLPLLRTEAARYSISLRTDLAAELPNVPADRVQLQQVLMNLMINAIDAMKDVDGARELAIKSQRYRDEQLQVSVSDTGVGLPAEQEDKIFDAFFTTKTQGTGMGLGISRSIVESHGGRLWAAANSPRGANFYFTLSVNAQVPQ